MRTQILFTRDYQEIGSSAPRWQNLEAVISRAAGTLTLTGISLESRLRDLWVYADPLIEKVFFNLLENSLRHGGNVSTVRVFSRESDEGLTIVYEDNGVGVPADVKEKIFRREYFQNTGLGLYLSREILAITKMEIRETGITGEGARFEIFVPKGSYGTRVQEMPA
jgi:signal transduction histidine kinase